MRQPLPIDAVLPDVLDALGRGAGLVLAAPPGAGKTTRVPLALQGADWLDDRRILMLEPRRLAARAAAERMAAELGEPVGQTVGYRIRGERRTGAATRIEVVTEGILTRMLQAEPDLPGIGCVLFDEVHERSIHSDLGLALALEVQAALRPDLRLVAMSATLDTARFARLLGDAPVVEAAGSSFPVETRWLDRPWRRPGHGRRGLVEAAADLILRAADEAAGDVLAFLPGAGEIERVASRLRGARPDLEVATLYGAMPFARQRAVLDREVDGPRRVVLASAIAETSLTVPGIRVVVDSGLARHNRTDPGTGLSRLVTVPVSRAEADQRRGRAGRLGPGVCYRMWTRGEEGALPPFALPEILETDLAPLALELALWGAVGPEALHFLDPPPPAAFAAAQWLLADLGALNAERRITAHGRALSAEPLHPRLAHMVVAARQDGTPAEAAMLAALLSERDPLRGRGADLRDRLRAVTSRDKAADQGQVARIRAEATRIDSGRADPARVEALSGALAARAYPDRIALRRAGTAPRYLLSSGRGAILDPADALAGERLLVATDLEDGPEARIRLAVPIGEAELRDVLASRIGWTESVEWSARAARVEATRREMLGALTLREEVWREAPPERLGAALGDGVRAAGIATLPWSRSAQSLRARAAWLRRQGGPLAEALPDWSDEALLATLDDWLTPHLAGMRRIEEIAALDLTAILRAATDWPSLAEIDRRAPERIATPLGTAAIDYDREQPAISVRVQEMFGVTTHPTVGQPCFPLLVELLSPAGRPVQKTADLPGFWQNSYADVRREMRARYPKHPWPENPAEAEPTRRTKRTGDRQGTTKG